VPAGEIRKNMGKKIFFFASLMLLKKGVGSGSVSQRCGSGSAPKCHGPPTLVLTISICVVACIGAGEPPAGEAQRLATSQLVAGGSNHAHQGGGATASHGMSDDLVAYTGHMILRPVHSKIRPDGKMS
jgi:hypothetical protein